MPARRVRLFDFHFVYKLWNLGFETFFDGGRVWSDFGSHPELDGTGIGLKYGAGGGLRPGSGTAFILRADVAWSPDATPIGRGSRPGKPHPASPGLRPLLRAFDDRFELATRGAHVKDQAPVPGVPREPTHAGLLADLTDGHDFADAAK